MKFTKLLPILLLILSFTNAQPFKLGEAKGLFLSFETGPRFPVGVFSETHNTGIGGNLTLSYTDTGVLPFFIYMRTGFQNNPAEQNFLSKSGLSSISTNIITINPGVRYYFPPVLDIGIILMPVIEGGFTYKYSATQFCYGAGSSSKEKKSGYGFHAGAGFSAFLMEVLVNYQYVKDFQTISVDIGVRIPLYAKI